MLKMKLHFRICTKWFHILKYMSILHHKTNKQGMGRGCNSLLIATVNRKYSENSQTMPLYL